MLRGTVCQLHYAGGGVVEFAEASGSRVRRPFLHGPSLRIGQEVRFMVNSVGEAFGIEVLKPRVGGEAGFLHESQPKAAREQVQLVAKGKAQGEESLQLQRIARLQRCIGRFQNANLGERLEMLSRAEVTLKQLLEQADLDGDAICRLVRKVVGWLQAPRFLKHMTAAGGCLPTAGSTGDVQGRVRGLLISALSSLDLTDSTTRQAVETAVAYIKQLIQDVCWADLETSRAVGEWRQLQSLISMEGATSKIEDEKRRLRSEKLRGEDKAGVVEGTWSPNLKVRQLPSVFRGDPVQLTCPSCPASMTSKWLWRHPKTQNIYLLIPQNGCYHGGLRGRGAKADVTNRWRPVDERPTKDDKFQGLDFCHHQQRRSECRECGGYMICSHLRRRDKCRLCKSKWCAARSVEAHKAFVDPKTSW